MFYELLYCTYSEFSAFYFWSFLFEWYSGLLCVCEYVCVCVCVLMTDFVVYYLIYFSHKGCIVLLLQPIVYK